jgi:hypothetical protein
METCDTTGDLAVTNEHPGEFQRPTREAATGGASRFLLGYGWASPRQTSYFQNLMSSFGGSISINSSSFFSFPAMN